MGQIRRFRIPTKEEERELLMLANRGDGRARHELVTRNLRLVVMFATRILRRWKPFSVSFADLIQAGNIGLMEAVDNFDPDRFDVRFSTYAAWHINNRIWRTLKCDDRMIRFPVYLEDRIGDYLSAVSTCRREIGREPTITEISEKLGVSIGEVRKLETLSGGVLSLDLPVGDSDEDFSMISTLPSDDIPHDERVLWSEAVSALDTAFGCLSDDDRTMFLDYVGIYAERKLPAGIGKERGMTPRDVRVRISVIRTKLKLRMKRQKLRAGHFL
jgi:RNA polymerase sigma factor (sigma-70 family)